MSDPTSDQQGSAPPGPIIRDRRRLDPETGQLRDAYGSSAPPAPAGQPTEQPAGSPPASPASTDGSASEPQEPVIDSVGPDGQVGSGDFSPAGPDASGAHGDSGASSAFDGPAFGGPEVSETPNVSGGQEDSAIPKASETRDVSLDGILADLDAAQASAAERLSDLQRLQAEFVNYRRRVDRDRDVARDTAVAGFLEALLPVLDDIHLARQHGDLEGGPFAAIADKLDGVLKRFGLSRYGEQWDEFDPVVHEALMHTEAELPEGTLKTTVVQVLQPGYRSGDRVLRAARVAVADPH
jgi:molecular chaperone GrpE